MNENSKLNDENQESSKAKYSKRFWVAVIITYIGTIITLLFIQTNIFQTLLLGLIFGIALGIAYYIRIKPSLKINKLNLLIMISIFAIGGLIGNWFTKSFEAFLDNEALVIEYQGLYSNIHFEYSKNIVALLGFIGLQVQEILYQDKYCRFRFIVTPLTKSKKLNFKERGNLANNNEQKFFNSLEMLDDKRYHLWIKLSKDKNCIVSFLDYNSGKNFIINSFNQVNKLS